jgi:hypothetical protein
MAYAPPICRLLDGRAASNEQGSKAKDIDQSVCMPLNAPPQTQCSHREQPPSRSRPAAS